MASVIDAPAAGDDVRRHGDGTVDIDLDRVLVARAQAGDAAAFAELYEHYHRRLFGVCLRRLGDRHEAEDVVQESFARAWRSLPGFVGERRFYPWLSVIASHLCTDISRRRGRSVPVADLQAGNVMSVEESGEDLVLAQCERAEVAAALGRLNERHRRVLALREQHQWSYQQIAETEGIAISAVETLLWRARRALERCMAEGARSGQLALVMGLGSVVALVRRARGRVGRAGPVVQCSPSSAAARGPLGWCRTAFTFWVRRMAVAGSQWVGCQAPTGSQMAAFGAAAASVALSLAMVGGGGVSSAPPAAPGSSAASVAVGAPETVALSSPVVAHPLAAMAGRLGTSKRGALIGPVAGLVPTEARGRYDGGSAVASGAARGAVSGIARASQLLLRGFVVMPGSSMDPPGSAQVPAAPSGAASAGGVAAQQIPATSGSGGSGPAGNQATWSSGLVMPSEEVGADRSARTAGSPAGVTSGSGGDGSATSSATMPSPMSGSAAT